MDPLRLLLLLLLLGVSASRGESVPSDRTGTPMSSGFPEGKHNRALGSQTLGMDGGRGAPKPGSTEERPGLSRPEATQRSRVEMWARGAHGCGHSGTAEVCVEEPGGVSEAGAPGLSDA